MLKFSKSVIIKADIYKLFEFHRDTNNLKFISPNIIKTKIKSISDIPLIKGSVISLEVSLFGIKNDWVVSISECLTPTLIKDLQIKGIFKHWHHSHIFTVTDSGTKMTDYIEFKPPLGIFGYLGLPFVYFSLYLMFYYRHQKTKKLFEKND